MYINPLIEIVQLDDEIRIKYKYSDSKKPLIKFKFHGEKLDFLKNENRTKKINRLLNCKIVLSSKKEYLMYQYFLKNIDNSPDYVDKVILNKYVTKNLFVSKISFLDLSHKTSKLDLVLNVSAENTVFSNYVVIYKDINDLKKLEVDKKNGLILLFKKNDDSSMTVGPFIEKEFNMSFKMKKILEYITQKNKIVSFEEHSQNDNDNNLIFKYSILGILDYYSDYIGRETPFFERQIKFNKDGSINVFEKIPFKK